MQRSPRLFRVLGIASMLALHLLVSSTIARAQSQSPVQPEVTQPEGGSGASVDPFTGGFSFGLPVVSIPGPEGSGTSLTLSYRSGASPEGGASWVGYGWTLNPGAIVRSTRGIPDDWTDTIYYHNRRPQYVTLNVQPRFGIEIASDNRSPDSTKRLGGLGASINLSYNRRSGYFKSTTYTADARGLGSLKLTNSDTGITFAARLDPSALGNLSGLADSGATGFLVNAASQLIAGHLNQALSRTFNESPWVNTETPYSGITTDYQLAVTVATPLPIIFGFEFGLDGSVTRVDSDPLHPVRSVGYLYTSKADNESEAADQQDYHLDRDVPFTSNVKLLPIPISDPDQFSISGGGSFRFYHNRIGMYRPNAVDGSVLGIQGGGNLTVGWRLGVGVGFGLSTSSHTTSAWTYDPYEWLTSIFSIGIPPAGSEDRFSSFKFSQGAVGDNAVIRLANDLGGKTAYATNPAAERADADIGPIPPPSITPQLNGGEFAGRSVYVGYRTNRELTEKSGSNQVPFRAWGGDSLLYKRNTHLARYEKALQDQIGEFVVMGGDGTRYVYGLPVYQRNYREMYFGLPNISFDSAGRIQSQHRAFAWRSTDDAQQAYGREMKAPTAVAWLLTEIYAPGYIDRTNDGPTPDDYGGYTLFRYDRTAGSGLKSSTSSTTPWYRWRIPYNGLTYDRRTPFDPEDDIGTMSMGEREVYYLSSIETKSHIAHFVTNRTQKMWNGGGGVPINIAGSGDLRLDGYPAGANIDNSFDERAVEKALAGDTTATAAWWDIAAHLQVSPSQFLERIDLYAKDPFGGSPKILGATHFEYDYSLREGLRSSATPTAVAHDTDRVGMLTLRRVWFQNQNVIPAKISPWDFGYSYRTASEYPIEARKMYPEIAHFADSLDSLEQNPRWNPFQIDPWGNYQADGAERYANERRWVDQNPDTNHFDPAAWQLKTIRTPSQGEIEVQYEQNRYGWVQDRPAMGLVSLRSSIGDSISTDSDNNNRYYLNLADVGVRDTVREEVVRWHRLLKRMCLDSTTRVYFRMLYALNGPTASFTQPEYASDYVNGYGFIKALYLDSLATSPKQYAIGVRIGGRSTAHNDDVPKTVCLNYASANRRGLDRANIIPNGSDPAMLWAMLGKFGHADFNRSQHCLDIDYEHSYLRLPLLGDKRGGGIRVRRLLTLDRGPDGDTTLYGQEYLYEGLDRQRNSMRTSGVATNEPELAREENPLIDVNQRTLDVDLWSRLVAGEAMLVAEGPIGRTLLPGASVGYARVVTRSIYDGKSTPGFSIQEFYTAKDAPFNRWLSNFGQTADLTPVDRHNFNPIPAVSGSGQTLLGGSEATDMEPASEGFPVGIGGSYSQDLQTATQGSRFIIQDMHGAPRRNAGYGGLYSDPQSWVMTGMSETEYFAPGEGIPVVRRLGDSIHMETLGEEVDVAMETRSRSNTTLRATFEGDWSIGTTFLPIPSKSSAKASVGLDRRSLSTHTTSKVIRYPLIPKRTTSFADGMSSVSENVAFDLTTGSPVITRTYDGYHGLALQHSPTGHVGTYTSFAIPAGWEYPAMSQNAIGERLLLKNGSDGLVMTKGVSGPSTTVAFSGNSAAVKAGLARLAEGDLIRLTEASDTGYRGMYHIDTVVGSTVHLVQVAPTLGNAEASTGTVDLEVVRSGRTNTPGAPIGSFVTYGTPAADVQSGRYINSGLSSGALAVRRAFVDTLNAYLARGGGIILPSSYPVGLELVASGGGCAAPTDTIRIRREQGGVTVTRGRFNVLDTIVSSHGMVTHLNRMLDSLWGWRTSPTQKASDTLNNVGWRARSLATTPMSWIEQRNNRYDTVFAKVNGDTNQRYIRSFIVPSQTDRMTEAFKVGANPEYLYGRMQIVGVKQPDTITLEFDARPHPFAFSDSVYSLWRNITIARDTTLYRDTVTLTPVYLSDISGLRPTTSQTCWFGQDAQGYLTFIRYHFAGNDTHRVFGVRFVKSDTATLSTSSTDQVSADAESRFALDPYGRIILVPGDPWVGTSLLAGTQFCTSDTAYLHVTGVIAAGATTLSDEHTIESNAWKPVVSGNAFERREKNLWTPLQGFAYRTDVIGGARQTVNERTYANAGVFTDFKLFDWQHPERNGAEWMPGGDTVVLYSPLGMPLESKSRLGVPSAVRVGYNQTLPTIVAANANYNAIAFESFETTESPSTWNDVGAIGDVNAVLAHAGKSSYVFDGVNESDTLVIATITQQTMDEGLLVRFWGKPSDEALIDDGDVVVRLRINGSTLVDTTLAARHRVARTGQWSLFEVLFRPLPMSLGQSVELRLLINESGKHFRVDDVVMAPRTAEVACIVYDPVTRRAVATFDNNHFGVYPQYNAEGRPVRTIVETARGIRTVAEAHANTPRVDRVPPLPEAARRRDSDPVMSRAVAAVPPASDLMLGEGEKVEYQSPNFSLADVQITPDRIGVRFPLFDSAGSMVDPVVADLTKRLHGIGDIRKLEQLAQLYARADSLSHEAEALGDGAGDSVQAAARGALERERQTLLAQGARLLKRLRLNEAEARQLIEAIRSAKSAVESKRTEAVSPTSTPPPDSEHQ